jgi:hypothetical protein
MPVLVEVARLVARMVVVLTGNFLRGLVAVAVLVEIAGLVARVVMVLTGNLLRCLVTVSVLVEVTGLVAGVVVVLTGLFLRHDCLLSCFGCKGERPRAVLARSHPPLSTHSVTVG